jgi:hypothetical protein
VPGESGVRARRRRGSATALKSGHVETDARAPGGTRPPRPGRAHQRGRKDVGVGETRGIQGTDVAPGAPVTNGEGRSGPERGERAAREGKALDGEGPGRQRRETRAASPGLPRNRRRGEIPHGRNRGGIGRPAAHGARPGDVVAGIRNLMGARPTAGSGRREDARDAGGDRLQGGVTWFARPRRRSIVTPGAQPWAAPDVQEGARRSR